MKQLYKFFVCTLFAAGACVGAAAQQLPFNESDTYFVKVGNPADGKNGYIHYNPEGNYFDLVTSKWEADPVHFHIAGNEFQLVNIGDGPCDPRRRQLRQWHTPRRSRRKRHAVHARKERRSTQLPHPTVGAKGYLNNYAEQGKLAFWQANGPGIHRRRRKSRLPNPLQRGQSPVQALRRKQSSLRHHRRHLFSPRQSASRHECLQQPAHPTAEIPRRIQPTASRPPTDSPQHAPSRRILPHPLHSRRAKIPQHRPRHERHPQGGAHSRRNKTLFYYDGERLTAYATGQGLANEANNASPPPSATP